MSQYHLLSFEGPDPYAMAGGLGTRIHGLMDALGQAGREVHLWFVGDPAMPGHEQRGSVHLHRWCQWMSAHKPGGVYDGDEEKATDYAASLPPYILRQVLLPALLRGEHAVVIAEEWQTAHAVLHLDWLLRRAGLRDRVTIVWNANNTFGFDRVDWGQLQGAASITTVSRYMKHKMQAWGVDPAVIPNGLSPDAYLPPDRASVQRLRRALSDRVVLTKMARFDPDKRWLTTVHIAAEMKRRGTRPLLIARGGSEAHGSEVLAAAGALGLHVVERSAPRDSGTAGLVEALSNPGEADVIHLRSFVDPDARRVLFRSSDAVLANSSHEPFGLVGLEAMAVGGIACTGCSGEDYAVPGRNAVVLQTADPGEFIQLFERVRADRDHASRMRRAGRATARDYAWPRVIADNLEPWLGLAAESQGAAALSSVA
ncbi:MAG: glycosyltransferase family 4 protein [Myxococcales bacterium]|jgi:glycosyltransferase involved in cell wall biosynthesis